MLEIEKKLEFVGNKKKAGNRKMQETRIEVDQGSGNQCQIPGLKFKE